ncbi:Os08g0409366 [Oryza sativa Japonica Group]|uniref:Os08g0409366 protein n=1 Tax=Oryza sativa subsp. japonica TaxID=39947 RepID=A0A0N7KPU4_ORYSJ|nr:Os08g0409366 [Oryza sativa Japonica Group]
MNDAPPPNEVRHPPPALVARPYHPLLTIAVVLGGGGRGNSGRSQMSAQREERSRGQRLSLHLLPCRPLPGAPLLLPIGARTPLLSSRRPMLEHASCSSPHQPPPAHARRTSPPTS